MGDNVLSERTISDTGLSQFIVCTRSDNLHLKSPLNWVAIAFMSFIMELDWNVSANVLLQLFTTVASDNIVLPLPSILNPTPAKLISVTLYAMPLYEPLILRMFVFAVPYSKVSPLCAHSVLHCFYNGLFPTASLFGSSTQYENEEFCTVLSAIPFFKKLDSGVTLRLFNP